MQRSGQIMDDAADWLLRRYAGLDAAGEQDLARWLAQDPTHRAAFESLAGPWQALDGLARDPQIDALREDALALPSEVAEASGHRAWVWPRVMAAGLALLAVGGGAWWALQHSADTVTREVLETGKAQRQDFVLADGSVVTLDAASRVELALSAHRRALDLVRGQAYFRVAHDRSRPFVVAAGAREVVAVGTEFDIRRGAEQVTVALTQGRVRVEPTGTFSPSQPMVEGGTELTVGQALTFDRASRRTLITAIDLAAVQGWRQGRLHFDHTTLASAVEDFNRYADKPLRLVDLSLAGLPVSGVFRAQDARGFLAALSLLYPVRVQEKDDEILLKQAPR